VSLFKYLFYIISGIAKIEFEYDAWPDLFHILISTADNPQKSYRISSLTTIGYIGQEVNERKITDDKKSELLNALLQNIYKENDEEVLEIALEAFKNFSFIITNIIQNKVKINFQNSFNVYLFLKKLLILNDN
jgi:hypothetical protein